MLGADSLPGPLLDLSLIDLPGIGRKMRRRLEVAGVSSVEAFWRLSPRRARAIWGGTGGEYFWYGLRGIDPPERETRRGSVSHRQVLAPDMRDGPSALLLPVGCLPVLRGRRTRQACKKRLMASASGRRLSPFESRHFTARQIIQADFARLPKKRRTPYG